VPLRGCPVEALIREHGMGPRAGQGPVGSSRCIPESRSVCKRDLIKNLRGIAELYPNHIWKEDYLLFPMSNKVLSAEDQQNLSLEFEKVEETVGRAVHEQFERLSEQLAQIA